MLDFLRQFQDMLDTVVCANYTHHISKVQATIQMYSSFCLNLSILLLFPFLLGSHYVAWAGLE